MSLKLKIPKVLPIITLVDTLLMPQAFVPLYLFEPKYCKMLNDALDDHRMFAIALAKNLPSIQSFCIPHTTIGVGLVRACVKNSNGTFHLILQGIARAKVIQITRKTPYHMAKIKVMPSISSTDIQTEALMLKVTELILERVEKFKLNVQNKMFQFLKDLKDPDIFSDIISYNFIDDLWQRQKLLEILDVNQRLRELILILSQNSITPLRPISISPKKTS